MLRLPFKSLEEEFKVLRSREVLQYQESKDPKVVEAGIQVRTGRKWRASEEVQKAKAPIWHRRLIGVVTHGKAGLRSFSTPHMNISKQENRHLVQQEVRAATEDVRLSKVVGVSKQGAWMKWEKAPERGKISLAP